VDQTCDGTSLSAEPVRGLPSSLGTSCDSAILPILIGDEIPRKSYRKTNSRKDFMAPPLSVLKPITLAAGGGYSISRVALSCALSCFRRENCASSKPIRIRAPWPFRRPQASGLLSLDRQSKGDSSRGFQVHPFRLLARSMFQKAITDLNARSRLRERNFISVAVECVMDSRTAMII
jgi:hypothetical protein